MLGVPPAYVVVKDSAQKAVAAAAAAAAATVVVAGAAAVVGVDAVVVHEGGVEAEADIDLRLSVRHRAAL